MTPPSDAESFSVASAGSGANVRAWRRQHLADHGFVGHGWPRRYRHVEGAQVSLRAGMVPFYVPAKPAHRSAGPGGGVGSSLAPSGEKEVVGAEGHTRVVIVNSHQKCCAF